MHQKLKAMMSSNLDQMTDFSMEIKDLSSAERMREAFKKLGLFLSMTCVSVFIPAAHFVLVPTFFCLSIYMFVTTLKKHHRVISGQVPCPSCQTLQKTSEGSFNWPMKVTCTQCQLQIRVDRV